LLIFLALMFVGTVWIDIYDVPQGFARLDCDFRVTPWNYILTSPKFYWALPIFLLEFAFWIRLLVWLWPVRALAKPVLSDWILLLLVFLLGSGIGLYAVSALQPAPWNSCS